MFCRGGAPNEVGSSNVCQQQKGAADAKPLIDHAMKDELACLAWLKVRTSDHLGTGLCKLGAVHLLHFGGTRSPNSNVWNLSFDASCGLPVSNGAA